MPDECLLFVTGPTSRDDKEHIPTASLKKTHSETTHSETTNRGHHAGVTDNYSRAGCQRCLSAGIYLIVRAVAESNNCGNTSALCKYLTFASDQCRRILPAP